MKKYKSGEYGVTGVILAAGGSSRFGLENKLFSEIDGVSIIYKSAQKLLDSKVDLIKVITGYQSERIEEELGQMNMDFVYNKEWKIGQSSSVKMGLSKRRENNAVMFTLGDMPFVKTGTINKIIEAGENGDENEIVVAGYKGIRGNPVLFNSDMLGPLEEKLRGDTGGRKLLKNENINLIETGDRGVLFDIDTEDDLIKARDYSKKFQ